MAQTLILNDLHIGVSRVAGATPQTAMQLRGWVLQQTEALMFSHADKDIIFNGDIFDAYDVALGDVLRFYVLCRNWLAASDRKLVLAQGNHDISKDSSRLSAFAFLAGLLEDHPRVRVVTEPVLLAPNLALIPHCTNQEVFNLELERALLWKPTNILLHANYDNKFAIEADHSLNVSRDQAVALVDRGHVLIFGHEHQQREPRRGVIIAGNQFPTSVADCLGNGTKRALILGDAVGGLTEIETWAAAGSFHEIDWRTLNGEILAVEPQFIRVTGEASAAEAASVISAVSRLRQKSTAFVVTNAVKIEGIEDMAEIEVAASEMRALDVLAFLYEQLEPEQVRVLKELLKDASND